MNRPTEMTSSDRDMGEGLGGKHTPGPWDLIAYPDGQAFEVEGGGCIMALVHYNDGAWTEYSEAEANARLIASAPTLYTKVAIAAIIFREYERLHLAKGSRDGDAKALRNAQYAEEMEAALNEARGQ